MTTATTRDFDIEVSKRAPGYNVPQKMGRALWAPMWLMALGFFLAGTITGIVRANAIANGDADTKIQALGHLGPGLQFLGFMAVFAAISFAIARILGVFRQGGGEVQQATGRRVETLKMPVTAKVFILLMAMAMMTLIVASIVHFAYAAGTASGSISLESSRVGRYPPLRDGPLPVRHHPGSGHDHQGAPVPGHSPPRPAGGAAAGLTFHVSLPHAATDGWAASAAHPSFPPRPTKVASPTVKAESSASRH